MPKNTPHFKSSKFQCPHCRVVSQQRWFDENNASSKVKSIITDSFLDYRKRINHFAQGHIEKFIGELDDNFSQQYRQFIPSNFAIATCESCSDITIWVNKEIIYPKKTSIDAPNDDLSGDIKSLYNEAATIFIDSPKGSTALLRLALQMLLKQIGKEGKNINNDIKELVSEGLSPKIQQALDLLRVVGNNAVHPGQINLDDNKDVALKLFHILNFTADELITKPKELGALYNDVVPENTIEHINQRDG